MQAGNRHMQRGAVAILLFAGFLEVGPATAAWESPMYGPAHHQDGLANTRIGPNGRKVAYRFRAKSTGHVESVKFYLVRGEPGAGYAAGDGGKIRVELRPDDPENPGFPSGKVLASAPVPDPIDGPSRRRISFAPEGVDATSDLSNLPFLEYGKRYHLVFVNDHPDPDNNYVSVNSAWMREPRHEFIQPGVRFEDLAVTRASRRKRWSVRQHHTPIFELIYWNGARQGRAYQYGAESHQPFEIRGDFKLRERFTVSTEDRVATAVFIRVKKVGAPSSLSLELKKGGAESKTVARVDLSPTSIPAGEYTWVGGPIDYILEAGEEYYLLLEENSDGNDGYYKTFPVSDGGYNGFQTGFTDGVGEICEGDGRWKEWRNRYADLQFYFELNENETLASE